MKHIANIVIIFMKSYTTALSRFILLSFHSYVIQNYRWMYPSEKKTFKKNIHTWIFFILCLCFISVIKVNLLIYNRL